MTKPIGSTTSGEKNTRSRTEVPCRLTHDGEVMVDRPLPWATIAVETQARRAERRTIALVVAFLTVAACLLVFSESIMPNESLISLLLMVMGLVAVFVRPVSGIYLIAFFTLLAILAR